MTKEDLPILVFDSGAGGISVLKEIVKIMPEEKFIFFGDSKNAPYGTRSVEEVQSLTIGAFLHYRNKGIKACAVACNTATSAAVRKMRTLYKDIPIVGIEPAVKPAVIGHPGARVLVMATPMTIHGNKLHALISKYDSQAEIIPLACPGLMEYVEEGKYDSEDVQNFLEELLAPYKKEPVSAAVLGCTHYPFLRKPIQKVLGDDVEIFDGAPGTARELKRRITKAGLIMENSEDNEAFFKDYLSDETYNHILIDNVLFETSDPDPDKLIIFKNLYLSEI